MPDNIKEGLEIIPVENMDQVLEHALQKMPIEIEWDEEAYYASRNLGGDNGGDVSQAH